VPVPLLTDPPLGLVLDFCARDPVERVFLEEMARRGTGRFTALERGGEVVALCHAGTNVVPSGEGAGAFAGVAAASGARMLIGEELGIDPLARDPDGFRLRTRVQIDEGRSWLWLEDGVVLFKAEASAWTASAVQLAQVWTDPAARGHGYAQRALRDLIRLLLGRVPTVTLFVRTENDVAIRLYERVGMRRALTYRSVLF